MVSRRHTPPTTNFTKNLISRLTKRTDNLTQQFWPAQAMNSEETAAFLRSLVHGQNRICEDIAKYLRRRAARDHINDPIGIFLLAGTTKYSKITLARELASLFDWPLITVNMNLSNQKIENHIDEHTKHLPTDLYDYKNAIVMIYGAEKAMPYEIFQTWQKAWDVKALPFKEGQQHRPMSNYLFLVDINEEISFSNNGKPLSPKDILLFFQSKGLPDSLLEKTNRIYVFQPLTGLDLAKAITLEIENLINSYGLHVPPNGINPNLLLPYLKDITDQKADTIRLNRATQAIDSMIAESLVIAKQKEAKIVQMTTDGEKLYFQPVNKTPFQIYPEPN